MFKNIADTIFQDVFDIQNPYSLDQLRQKFAFDIPRAKKVKCALSGKETWSFSDEGNKIASPQAIEDRFQKDEWMRKKIPLHSIEDVLHAWEEIQYIRGEKYIDAQDVFESNGVYQSRSVYHSISIFNSSNIMFSYKLFDCSSMFGCRDSSSCTFGIRIKESVYSSSCFEISWSSKISKSLYVHDGFDLFECMFCSHLRSKKYCIANIQFGKDEYMRIKKMMIVWITKPF